MKHQNNSGFSLIELIVTILIMSILTAGVIVSVAAMHRADADKEANKIASVLAKARLTVLSKQDESYVRLYTDEEGQHHIALMSVNPSGVHSTLEEVDLDDKVVIAYKPMTGDDVVTLTGNVNQKVNIYFSKASGAFKNLSVQYIQVTADKELYICLVEDTGRCYIDTTY